MTREEAGKLAVIAKAYADGKEIEVYDDEDKEWVSIDDPSFDCHVDRYRIKPEPTYRPFKDADECFEEMRKHEPFGWVISRLGEAYNIWHIGSTSIRLHESICGLACAMVDYVFADGTPFGVKEEEEES